MTCKMDEPFGTPCIDIRGHKTDKHLADAGYSQDGRHRYWLTWQWNLDGDKTAVWIMLNPSTATERDLDPTLRRCAKFSRDWGYDLMMILNAYSFRATDPKVCMAAPDRTGDPVNRCAIEARVEQFASLLVVAWGGKIERSRAYEMRRLVGRFSPHCLGTTDTGQPVHPLYQRADLEPVPWTPPT